MKPTVEIIEFSNEEVVMNLITSSNYNSGTLPTDNGNNRGLPATDNVNNNTTAFGI